VLDRTAACADDFRETVRETAARTGLPEPELWAGEIGAPTAVLVACYMQV
jgi:hypothetical protein